MRKLRPRLTRGGTLRDVLDTASQADLQARAVRALIANLKALRLPCILHWSFDHFVVLENVSRSTLTIVDPARGRIRVGREFFEEHYTGIAVEFAKGLTPPTGLDGIENDKSARQPLKTSMFFKPILKLSAISFFVLSFSLITPLIIQVIVDEVLVANDYDLLLVVCGVFLLAHISAGLATYLQQMHILRATAQTRQTLTYEYLQRLLANDFSFFAESGLGKFVAQYTSLQKVVTTFISVAGLFGMSIVFSGAISAVLFIIDPGIALIVIAISATVVIARLLAVSYARRLEDATISAGAREEAYFVETMRGITSVAANQLEPIRLAYGIDRTIETVNASFRSGRFKTRFTLFNQSLKAAEIIIVVYLLAMSVMKGEMSIGVMYVFFTYRQFLDTQLSSAVGGLSDILNLRVHQNRLEEVMNASVSSKPRLIDYLRLNGAIAFCNVDYSIDGGRTQIIRNFSGTVRSGEFVAVCGPTGVGKSTLLRLALYMSKPDSGHMEYDGIRLDKGNISVLRNSVGVVLQEDTLFSGSVLDNISRFSEAPDYDRVAECCRLTCIDEELQRMPMGLMTEVGDLGQTCQRDNSSGYCSPAPSMTIQEFWFSTRPPRI